MTLIAKACCCFLLLLASILDVWMKPGSSSITAFVDVTLVPMDRERTVAKQTVLVKDGRISKIDDSKNMRIPEGAQVISGTGLFLMPGLADMHVHLHSKADALLLVANGVTTVRNMRGTSLHLAWRPQIENGKLLAPSIYSCGPILDGTPPTGENVTILQTDEEIERNIAYQKELGFDCVKVYNRLSPTMYAGIINAARRHGLSVAGHVPFSVGLSGALAMGQDSIEHLTGYIAALRLQAENHEVIDEKKIPELAKKTQKAGVWNCPTLVVQQNLTDAGEDFEKLAARPEMKYVARSRLEMWNPSRSARFQALDQQDFQAARRGLQVLSGVIYQLKKNGARLLLGTDAPSHFVVPGFSAHQELENLVRSGLSPYEALQTGTRNPAEFLKQPDKFGTAEVGKRADLVLIKCNPLKNISCTKQIAGVMLHGSWIPAARIQEILKSVVDSYRIPQDRFQNLPELVRDATLFARYEITTNGTVVGEERFSLVDSAGYREIISQQISDAPFEAIHKMKIRRAQNEIILDFESLRPEGPGRVEIKLADQIANMQASLPYRQDEQRTQIQMPEDSILDAPFMAAKTLLLERFRKLPVGKTAEFEVKEFDPGFFVTKSFDLQDSRWMVRRESDSDFAIQIKWQYQQATAKLVLDKNGWPLFYQRGIRAFRRL